MAIIDTISGYQAEADDFIIVGEDELQLRDWTEEDDGGRWFTAYSYTEDDVVTVYIADDLRYDIWGE